MSLRRTVLDLVVAFVVDRFKESVGRQIISDAFDECLSTMKDMCANEGQLTVFRNSVVSAFVQSLSNSNTDSGWNYVNIGEYMEFMGEIVEAGNQIMSWAYEEAANLDLGDGEFNDLEAAELGEEYKR